MCWRLEIDPHLMHILTYIFLFVLFFSFAQEICTIQLLQYYIKIVCSFFNADKSDCYIYFIIIFNSMIHYHKLHSSNWSQAYPSQLPDFQCCLPRYTKAAGSTKLKLAWGKPTLILLRHKLFVCFPIEIMGIMQHSWERWINTYS